MPLKDSELGNELTELRVLDAKVKALLPPQYEKCYHGVPPDSMGSAALKFDAGGRVAWDQIWTSFCDLALAGGPPHRGTLLEPATPAEVWALPEAYQAVVAEIARGIWLVTELPVLLHASPGWVGVNCTTEDMAAWLVRALVAENLSCQGAGRFIYVPAGPHFRLEKEIKNVVTALAKSCHYWTCHMDRTHVFPASGPELLVPALAAEIHNAPEEYQAVVEAIERDIKQTTGLATMPSKNSGWVGIRCADVAMTVWLLRAIVVDHVLVRREENVLYLPANPTFLDGGLTRRVINTFAHAFHLWKVIRTVKV